MGWASEHLQRGETVTVRPRGHSMTGRVNDRDLVTVEPRRSRASWNSCAAGVEDLVAPSPEQPSTLRTCGTVAQVGREGTTMLTETGARSATLREPDIAALRRRVLVARHQVAHVEASATAECQGALVEARRTYVADVEALLDDRRELLQTIAALRRVAVAAEAALAESRAGQQAKRAADLVQLLKIAGYAQGSAAAHASV
jgi:hypothetical protein